MPLLWGGARHSEVGAQTLRHYSRNPSGTGVCETCAERGRPNEPVYKMGMCEFCYKGLPHPKATRKEVLRERETGGKDLPGNIHSRTTRDKAATTVVVPEEHNCVA